MTGNKTFLKPYPLGAHCEAEGIRFSFASDKASCGIILYDRYTGKRIKKIPFLKDERIGKIYCKYLTGVDAENLSYQFYAGNEIIPDERARAFAGALPYGKERRQKDFRAVFPSNNFDWSGDGNPRIPYENCIVYCMHVRGFTKHPSSGVLHKGTFAGIAEKLDYLKETGITTVELQPAYDFTERRTKAGKLNYWGYQRGFYYTPKAGYASTDDAQTEFKNMVKEFHKKGMEIVMQFYFPKDVPRGEIPDILRFWVLEYHVDGFHLLGESIPVDLIVGDAALCDSKIWLQQFDTDAIYDKDEKPDYCNLAEYRDDYFYTMRKFLKGDEDMLGSVLYQMRHIPKKCGRIHYMSNYYSMTLKDMVSYDYKHNEANGEDNRDGSDYNCSWNCGEEGTSRKKTITALRLSQIKNAMCILTFTQSTPLIFMGDEFGNSQQGNNNPYCQDNQITWLNWNDLKKNQEIHQFWKTLMKFRREHPVLHPATEHRIMDYMACGYPDLSYHGESAWFPRLENYFRYVGLMYCGKYAKKDALKDDDFIYIAMNMHWEAHELALPKLPKGLVWRSVLATAGSGAGITAGNRAEAVNISEETRDRSMCTVPARGILVLISESVEGNNK